MFPIFLIGFLAGAFITAIYFYWIKSIPSNTKFKMQEDTLRETQEDLRTLKIENETLRRRLEQLKEKVNKKKK